jgi:hypothetical protein
MNVFFCPACAKPRAESGVCSQRCATVLATVKPLHPRRSGSKVIVPINSRVGQIFRQVCASTGNNHTLWKNYQGELVLPAPLVDGVAAHIFLQHIGGKKEDEEEGSRLAKLVSVDVGYISPPVLKQFVRISPEILTHVLPHIPIQTAFYLGATGAMKQRSSVAELEEFLRDNFFAKKIKSDKVLLEKEKREENEKQEEKKKDRLKALTRRQGVLYHTELELKQRYSFSIDPLYQYYQIEEDAVRDAKKTIDVRSDLELFALRHVQIYDTENLTSREADIAAHCAFLSSRPSEVTRVARAHLYSVIQKLDRDEKRTTYNALTALPPSVFVLDFMDVVEETDRILYNKEDSPPSVRTDQTATLLANTPFFLTRGRPLLGESVRKMRMTAINIEGPNSLEVYYSAISDKTIVLLGEFHMEEKCQRGYAHLPLEKMCDDGNEIVGIANYLRALIWQSESPIDLLLESHPFDKQCEHGRISYLDEVVHASQNWTRENPLLRRHLVDVRQAYDYNYRDYFLEIYDFLFVPGSPEPSERKLPTTFGQCSSLICEVGSIPRHVYAFWRIKFEEAVSAYVLTTHRTVHERAEAHFAFFMVMMDLYTIGKMFSDTGQNIIFYGGKQHTRNLAAYLDKLGCDHVMTQFIKDEKWHCLPLIPPSYDPPKYYDTFFFAPVRQITVNQGFDELTAFLLRPAMYVRMNEMAPRYSLMGLFAGGFTSYQLDEIKILALYKEAGFLIYLTYFGGEVGSSFTLFIRSPHFKEYALTDDKEMLAVYMYRKQAVSELSPDARMVLSKLIYFMKYQETNQMRIKEDEE